MPKYVDGYVIPIPKKNLKAYLRMAKMGAALWKEHGALAYAECVGEDLNFPFGQGFKKMAKLKPGETVIFAFVTFRSRAHRDKVNAAVMKDPRMSEGNMEGKMPFDPKRFAAGGFEVIVAW